MIEPMKNQRPTGTLPAADLAPRPGDFPLGSIESRAAMRMFVEAQERQSGVAADPYPPGWSSKTAAQKAALESNADILFFGGAAGSLKTETILVDAIRERNNPNLRAIIFRQQFTHMTDIVEKTHRLYTPLGARFVGQPSWTWTFPSGAKVRLAYIASDNDVWEYLGPRYSFIGFDESTMHTEFQVRNMLGRLSSTDHSLNLRVRLASNPGNVGAAWHKRMFLRGACPVHQPRHSAEPGKLYRDASWPSDSFPLVDEHGNGFTVAFIPGRVTDHILLDDRYVYRLRMMSGALSKAMEQGCWCDLQGAYFANWNASRMVVPYAAVGERWWDTHFISLDYGFGKSSASAHLHVRTQDGRLHTVGEFVAAHLPAYEFAQEVVARFVAPRFQQNRRRIVAVYLDPSNFRNIGDGHTIADQINEVLEPYDLGVLAASNDRPGGWQLMYKMLQTGEWQVADTCPKLMEAIPSRIHNEKKPGDILKVPGDPLDDVADDVRYGIYTFITVSEEPFDLRKREELKQLAQQGDLTSALIRFQQMQEASEPRRRPIQLGRYRTVSTRALRR
jgi:hypothetical protein